MGKRHMNKGNRFVSLKVKWALGTSLGSMIIFLVLAMTLVSAFTTDLLRQERHSVRTSMVTVARHIDSSFQNEGQFTSERVGRTLFEKPNRHDRQGSYYHHSMVQNLANANLTVKVYDRQGRPVFATGKTQRPLRRDSVRSVQRTRGDDHQIYVGYQPLKSNATGKTLGYLQVENHLTSYYQHVRRLHLVCGLLLILVIIVTGLMGYFLSFVLLRPLSDIHDTVRAVRNDPVKDIRVPEMHRHDELSELGHMVNEMLDQMQRYIEQQSQFVSDVSHELRTPITIIQGHVEMLDRWGKKDPKLLDSSIKAVLQETSRMNSLVQEMLDLSRAEEVDVQFKGSESVVNDVVTHVYNDYKMVHPDFMFMLDNDLKEKIKVPVYHDHLEQILIILCDNAVKYSTKRKEIHITLSRNLNSVEIGVQDFGEGIGPEDAKRVFDRFYRVDKARSRKKGGNGLGLAIAKRLVEGYHGTISLESSLGYGSLFRVTLPIVDEPKKKDKHN